MTLLSLLPPQIKLIAIGTAGLALSAGCVTGYLRVTHKAYRAGAASVQVRFDAYMASELKFGYELNEKLQRTKNLAESAHAKREIVYVTKYRTIQQTVDKYVDSGAAHNRCLDDGGLRIAQAAIDTANASLADTPVPIGPELPATAPGAHDGGSDGPMDSDGLEVIH